MKRLVITGLPCPAAIWDSFLGNKPRRGFTQRVIPMREVLEHCPSPDPRQMANYISTQITDFRPDSIVCHDLGVALTLLSLLKIQRKEPSFRPRVTVFNGAFRRVNPIKAPHLFKVQFMRDRNVIREVEARGGKVDLTLRPYLPRIRAMYRLILLFRVTEQISSAFGLDDLIGSGGERTLKLPVQIIASPNDPYIPIESVRRLSQDFGVRRFVELRYGHFPYSIPREHVLPLIEDFESSSTFH
jgi:pimeloyl-ACP methyl ester carboxylesterase